MEFAAGIIAAALFNRAAQSTPTTPTVPQDNPQPQLAASPSVSLSQRPMYTLHISYYEAFSLFGNKKAIKPNFTMGVFEETGLVVKGEFAKGSNWLYSNSHHRVVPIPAHIACWDIETIGKRTPGTQDVFLEFYRKPATRVTQALRLVVLLVLFGIFAGFFVAWGTAEGSGKRNQLMGFLAGMGFWLMTQYVHQLVLPGHPLEFLSWILFP